MISIRDRAVTAYSISSGANAMRNIGEKCGTCGANLIRCTCGWLGCECEPEAMEAQCEGHFFSCPWCGTTHFDTKWREL